MKKDELKKVYFEKMSEVKSYITWAERDNKAALSDVLEVVQNSCYAEEAAKADNFDFHNGLTADYYETCVYLFESLIEKLKFVKRQHEKQSTGRGGKREGAGRKGFGVTKKVSLTLPVEVWAQIEELCNDGAKQSQVLRDLIEHGLKIE